MLDALDAADEANPAAKQRRKYERLRYRCGPTPIALIHPGGSTTKVDAYTRNISAGGVCFLTCGFVHPGSKCTIQLINAMGRQVTVKGLVRWCSHVSGRMHQMGATFDTPVDTRQYVSSTTGRGAVAQRGLMAEIVPARLLYVDAEAMDRELMKMTLANSPMQVNCVDGPVQAMKSLVAELYDVLIADSTPVGQSGADFVKAVRTSGFRGPILLLTVDGNSAGAKAAIEAGADELIAKPYDAAELIRRVSNHVRARSAPTGDAPIYSEMADALPSMEPVQNYIEAARRKVSDIEKAINEDDAELAASVCEVLMATGTGFGFPVLTDCATIALWTVKESKSVSGARDELRRLGQVIARLAVRNGPADINKVETGAIEL